MTNQCLLRQLLSSFRAPEASLTTWIQAGRWCLSSPDMREWRTASPQFFRWPHHRQTPKFTPTSGRRLLWPLQRLWCYDPSVWCPLPDHQVLQSDHLSSGTTALQPSKASLPRPTPGRKSSRSSGPAGQCQKTRGSIGKERARGKTDGFPHPSRGPYPRKISKICSEASPR